MARNDYISREAAIKPFINDNQHLYYPFEVQSRIRNIPSADVVEVVRCKDCKHLEPEYSRFAERFCYKVDDFISNFNWFCADGERKEEQNGEEQ